MEKSSAARGHGLRGVQVRVHAGLDECLASLAPAPSLRHRNRFAQDLCAAQQFHRGDALLFGSESSGLPAPVLERVGPAHTLSIPMRSGNRSLNLNNAVALVVYEAWRQLGFAMSP